MARGGHQSAQATTGKAGSAIKSCRHMYRFVFFGVSDEQLSILLVRNGPPGCCRYSGNAYDHIEKRADILPPPLQSLLIYAFCWAAARTCHRYPDWLIPFRFEARQQQSAGVGKRL